MWDTKQKKQTLNKSTDRHQTHMYALHNIEHTTYRKLFKHVTLHIFTPILMWNKVKLMKWLIELNRSVIWHWAQRGSGWRGNAIETYIRAECKLNVDWIWIEFGVSFQMANVRCLIWVHFNLQSSNKAKLNVKAKKKTTKLCSLIFGFFFSFPFFPRRLFF